MDNTSILQLVNNKLMGAKRISVVDLFESCDTSSATNRHDFIALLLNKPAKEKKQSSPESQKNLTDPAAQTTQNDSQKESAFNKIRSDYEAQNYDLVLKGFPGLMKGYKAIAKNKLDILADSIIKSSSTSAKDILYLIGFLQRKFKKTFSCQLQIQIYMKLIEVGCHEFYPFKRPDFQ